MRHITLQLGNCQPFNNIFAQFSSQIIMHPIYTIHNIIIKYKIDQNCSTRQGILN